MIDSLNVVVCGLTISSSWGNGHATTYRALLKALAARGHRIHFLERDVPWYRDNRDLSDPPYCELEFYKSVSELKRTFRSEVSSADAVIIGSYVPDGVAVGEWLIQTANGPVCFYDIDTPVTARKLRTRDYEYLSRKLVAQYDSYFSFTGGPLLREIEREFHSPRARVLYCAVDETVYFPEPPTEKQWSLGYLGTYSDDRQPTLEKLLFAPATELAEEHFVVAGSMYPDSVEWPSNVRYIHHLPPSEHRKFYNAQRWTLNVTRADMIAAGYSPSVRLFEAASCGTPIISDYWDGIDTIFRPGEEIVIARSTSECVSYLTAIPESERRQIGARARARVLAEHTASRRAEQLENYLYEAMGASERAAQQAAG